MSSDSPQPVPIIRCGRADRRNKLGYLLDLAHVTAACALNRTESRGAHFREDFPKRDDAQWLKHTLAYRRDGAIEFRYKPVVITRFQPQERKY
jgi:succinate dehydrogenase / fumarate reductase flavoprotein subunit